MDIWWTIFSHESWIKLHKLSYKIFALQPVKTRYLQAIYKLNEIMMKFMDDLLMFYLTKITKILSMMIRFIMFEIWSIYFVIFS
jgi:hypothetical protein